MHCTQSDIINQLPEATLIELTDDLNTGAVDADVVARAIADADAEIESYCRARYSLPFSPVPAGIRKLSVDLAIYNLYMRRAALDIPESVQKRYDNAVRFLRDLSKGVVSLGSDAPAEADADLVQTTTSANDRIFTRDTMSGW